MRMRDEAAERRRVEPPAAHRQEERGLRPSREVRAGVVEVQRDEMRRLLPQRNDAILRALAGADVDELLLEVDVAEVEADRFGAPEPGRVDELHERAVAQPERRCGIEPVDDSVDLTRLRRLRKAPPALRGEARIGHGLRPEREAEE